MWAMSQGHFTLGFAHRAVIAAALMLSANAAFAQTVFAQSAPMGLTQGSPTAPPPGNANDPGYVLDQYPDRLPETSTQCIFFRTLYDWQPLNNTSLIVWAPSRSHPYQIKLDRPCFGLKFAHTIGFTSRDSRLCGFGGDAVLVESGGGPPDRCPIGSITALTEEGLKSLQAQAPGRSQQDKQAEEKAEQK